MGGLGHRVLGSHVYENSGMKRTAQQIGKAGELLVQYRLLLVGIESARMATDTGIDLVAYNPVTDRPVTIQVKSNLGPKPAGGTGKPALDWWVPNDCPAELVALVDLSEARIWLLTLPELEGLAQQQSNGRFHLYMYTDPTVSIKTGKRGRVGEFEGSLLEHRAHQLLGGATT